MRILYIDKYKYSQNIYNIWRFIKMSEIIKYTTMHRVMKDIADMSIASDAVYKMQKSMNILGTAIIESAYINALANGRHTLQEKDIDCALEALYNYSEAWDLIFEEDEENIL